MRVLYLTHNPNTYGTTRILCNWVELGREHGIQGHVVTSSQGNLTQWCDQQQVPWQVNPLPLLSRKTLVSAHWHALRLAWFARKHRIDLIHFNEHKSYGFIHVLRHYLKVPVVCHTRFIVNRAYTSWAFGRNHAPQALLWTSHQQQLDSAQALEGIVPPERQHVVVLGLDLDQFGHMTDQRDVLRAQWGCQPDDVVLGAWVILQPRKRPFDYLDMAARLIRERPNVRAVLAGKPHREFPDYPAKVIEHIKSLDVGDRILWLGHVDPIEPVVQAVDIGISTSEYETFGMSVCEAMACGKPVVAYRGGSVHEVLGDAGVILENGDTQGLYHETARLIDHPEERRRLGETGRHRVATQYNPKAQVKKLAAIYQTLLQGHPSA